MFLLSKLVLDLTINDNKNNIIRNNANKNNNNNNNCQ